VRYILTNQYSTYLDKVLIQSKFKIDIINKGSKILQTKFPELDNHKNTSSILISWLVDTDPYNRLQKEQTSLEF